MAEFLTWLHLTDLHFGLSGQPFLWPRVKNDFFKDLRKIADRSGPFDVVFFTGDFVQSGSTEEFARLSEELEELWGVFRKLGSTPVLCPIPGNHDVTRPSPSSVVLSLRHWWSDPEIRKLFWREPECDLRKGIDRFFQNYTDWLGKLSIPLPGQFTRGILPGDFSAVIQKGKLRLGVVGLNTTFLQIEAGDYFGKLDVHVSQVLSVCGNNADNWTRQNSVNVLLTHQAPDWLHPDAREHFRGEIYPTGRFHAQFSGHMHVPVHYDLAEGGASPRRLRRGPSLFGLEVFDGGKRTEYLHGYNAGRIELDGLQGIEKIWPRDTIRALSGNLRLCADQRYDALTEDEYIVSEFDIECEDSTQDEALESVTPTNDVALAPDLETDKTTQEAELSILNESVDESAAVRQLATCVRFNISPLPQHCAIRLDEQSQFENTLRQIRIVWIAADWGTGVNGFLSAAISRFSKQTPEFPIFHLRCDEASDANAFEALFPQQFGMSLPRFCALVLPIKGAFILLDGIQPTLCAGEGLVRFERIVHAIRDYCPDLKIVITSRMQPHQGTLTTIELRPLESPDVRTYFLHHPQATPDLCQADIIEKVHERSDGLPMHLDRMLRALKVSSLDSVLEAELEGVQAGQITVEDVPKALQQAVSALSSSTDKSANRSWRLLKVLSVLPCGETIEALRHFLPTEPFFVDHAVNLSDSALLEVIPLHTSAAHVGRENQRTSEYAAPKLLKVPRQIRDFVQSFLTAEERDEIITAGADYFFGRKWKDGKIKVRILPVEYREFLNSGPGNEFAVIHHLLQDAKLQGDHAGLRRAARLAVHYCRTLRSKDRFRDLDIVAGGMLQLVDAQSLPEQWGELSELYGLALRMTGRHSDALACLRNALELAAEHASDTTKASMLIDIALCEDTLGNPEAAVNAAEEVKKYAKENSARWFHAEAIIESNSKSGAARKARLKELERSGRTKGFYVQADNLALQLALDATDLKEKTALLDTVLKSTDRNAYNRSRAIVTKANAILDASQGGTLSLSERVMLSSAYSYLHAQRFGSLFDRAHSALWRVLEKDGDLSQLLRLFRHSSFIWRIRGEDQKEAEYAQRLSQLKPPEESGVQTHTIIVEIRYFWRRFKAVLAGTSID